MILQIDRAVEQTERLLEAIDAPQKEVFLKQGRSRLTSFHATSEAALRIEAQASEEIGHTVRFGNEKTSLAHSATGWPSNTAPNETRSPGGLRLPTLQTVLDVQAAREQATEKAGTTTTDRQDSPFSRTATGGAKLSQHPDSNRSLLSEGEARRLIENTIEHLRSELDGAFQLSGRLEDGAAESLVTNGHGVQVRQQARITSLRLQLSARGKSASVYTGGSAGVAIRPTALVQRLVDKLTIAMRARPLSRENSAALLSPEVICTLLQATTTQFLDSSFCGVQPFPAMVSIVDDPTLLGGVVFATHDGEGVPTRRTQLIAKGQPVGWIRPFTAVGTDGPSTKKAKQVPTTGCRYRGSWRELPIHSTSNLVLEPSDIAPAELVNALQDGVYLIGCDPTPTLDAEGVLRLKTVGFEIRNGDLGQPIKSRLSLPVEDLLRRVEAIARDLQHSALKGGIGAPTTLLSQVNLEAV